MNYLHQQIIDVQTNIDRACKEARRDKNEIVLVAVSKTHEAKLIEQALNLQLSHFGENRVQEAKAKWPKLLQKFNHATLHLIGPLQTNKAKTAVQLFDFIHTIDRHSIINAIAKEQQKQKRQPTCFIQINSGNEAQKAGTHIDDFHAIYQYAQQHDINIQGVMCIPPLHDDPSPHFLACKLIADEYRLPFKSFGMSNDFQLAISHGASHIRVGSAIFGNRST